MTSIIVQDAESLDWPQDGVLPNIKIECAGNGFFQYNSIPKTPEEFQKCAEEVEDDLQEETKDGKQESGEQDKDYKFRLDLFELSEDELDKLNYYQVLQLPFMTQLTPDQLRQAYRKACLKYHPDKSGRGKEDAVFLKVQTAFETLSNQKQAYDSTELPFDESIPSGSESPESFFKSYGMVFERNLHFDTRLLNTQKAPNGKKVGNNNTSNSNNKRGRNKKNKKGQQADGGPPSLGDENTSIEGVHRFYDYWAHFTTWRDFTIQAARELETEDQLEQAESRYEKRWYQKEIDRLAKKLKQKEQARITTLVERAMASDPRLKAEKQRLIDEKKMKLQQREQAALDLKRKEQEAKEVAEKQALVDKERRGKEKMVREKEKKLLRKTKQAFRRAVGEALSATSKAEHAMAVEVEMMCDELDKDSLTVLNETLASISSPQELLDEVAQRADALKNQLEIAAAAKGNEKETVVLESIVKEKRPFVKDELTALAKGIKKYPPGGANRWDQIAMFINNICKPEDPRTKEECIETYNKLANSPRNGTHNSNGASNGSSNGASNEASNGSAEAPKTDAADSESDSWTEEQDKQLQDGLVKFPASLDKNERWTSIAKDVPGKTKKDCVQRFKAIRDAIKNKK